jgi:hypothetical protein
MVPNSRRPHTHRVKAILHITNRRDTLSSSNNRESLPHASSEPITPPQAPVLKRSSESSLSASTTTASTYAHTVGDTMNSMGDAEENDSRSTLDEDAALGTTLGAITARLQKLSVVSSHRRPRRPSDRNVGGGYNSVEANHPSGLAVVCEEGSNVADTNIDVSDMQRGMSLGGVGRACSAATDDESAAAAAAVAADLSRVVSDMEGLLERLNLSSIWHIPLSPLLPIPSILQRADRLLLWIIECMGIIPYFWETQCIAFFLKKEIQKVEKDFIRHKLKEWLLKITLQLVLFILAPLHVFFYFLHMEFRESAIKSVIIACGAIRK